MSVGVQGITFEKKCFIKVFLNKCLGCTVGSQVHGNILTEIKPVKTEPKWRVSRNKKKNKKTYI